MKQAPCFFLAVVFFLYFAAFPVQALGGSDQFQNLEFFLNNSLKKAKTSSERTEIINLYLIKALALVYQQNNEQMRLHRETLKVLKEIRDTEIKQAREFERYISKR